MKPTFVGDLYPLRFKPRGARAVHAGREGLFGGVLEIKAACRGWYVSAHREDDDFSRRLPPDSKVTCMGCGREMARRLTPSERYVLRLRATPQEK